MHNNAQIVLKTVGVFAQYSAQPNKHAQLMYLNNAQYHSNSTQNSRRFYSTQYSLYSTIILKYVLTFLVICATIQFFNMDAFSS